MRPTGVVVQPAIARKGKGALDARMLQHAFFDTHDKGVLLVQRQVPAGAHINDGLFRFAFDKEFDRRLAFAKGDKDADHKPDHQRNRHNRHHGVARDHVDKPPEQGPAIARADTLFPTRRGGGGQGQRRQGRAHTEQDDTGQRGQGTRAHGGRATRQIGGVQRHQRAQKSDVQGHRHHRHARPQGQAHQMRRAIVDHPREASRHTAQNRQIDQRDDQRRAQNKDDGDGQHAHEFTRHTGPE